MVTIAMMYKIVHKWCQPRGGGGGKLTKVDYNYLLLIEKSG